MSAIDYIKRDRDLTFSHWRYRILHWTFGVKAKTPDSSPLPTFLYTHYCPLFHMTNILAVVSPVVMLIKIVIGLMALVGGAALYLWNDIVPLVTEPMGRYIRYLEEKGYAATKAKMSTPQYQVAQLRKNKAEEAANVRNWCRIHGSDHVTKHFLKDLQYLSIEESSVVVEKMKTAEEAHLERQRLNKERAEARKKEMAERMVFWIRFSQIFVKGLTGVVLALAACLLVYLLFLLVPAVFGLLCLVGSRLIEMISWCWVVLTNVSLAGVFDLSLQIIAGTAIVMVLTAVFYKALPSVFGFLDKVFNTPINIGGDIVNATGKTISDTVGSVFEFLSALYDDNCPAITVVTEDLEEYEGEEV